MRFRNHDVFSDRPPVQLMIGLIMIVDDSLDARLSEMISFGKLQRWKGHAIKIDFMKISKEINFTNGGEEDYIDLQQLHNDHSGLE
ncbi:hypothetical protein KIN20_034024 [Parelaphostrongylus tenuis]|uniref:Uncharacterized protein n=1 Tax=Parelaphostrongylus tenuis TaxID=148309 RepID=A0AAD5WJE3_PARTN|nr:hypothetical protein KIN20_034024 [Parelaphostrongylus tenuis]